jgi:hypothetical protein
MAGRFAFDVHGSTPQALAFLARWPVAFMDSQWLEAHLPLLRAAPAQVLTLLDAVTPQLHAELASAFPPGGGPAHCALWGIPTEGPRSAAEFVSRRRELLCNAFASPTLGIREQMSSFELDVSKTSRG